MQFNSNESVSGRESSAGPQRSSRSIFGRVTSAAYSLVSRLSRSPAGSQTSTSASAYNSGDESSNDSESLYTIYTATTSSESFSSSEEVTSNARSAGPFVFNAASQDPQLVGHAQETSHATVQSNASSVTLGLQRANNRNATMPRSLRNILNSPEPEPASASNVPSASSASTRRPLPATLDDARIENFRRFGNVIMGRERDMSPYPSSNSAYSSPSPEPRVGRLVPADFAPLRPLDPRSYGGFRSTSTRPVPAGYHGEARALSPSFQRSMPNGLVRQNAYADITNAHPYHELRREPAMPREQWLHYVDIVKDDSDSSDEDSDSHYPRRYSSSPSRSPCPGPSSRRRRPYQRHRAPSPPSPRRRQPTPGPSNLGRSHNVSDDERQGLDASARARRSRRATPYPSPSFESSASESESGSGSRPSASMYRRPNPQTSRASVERRRSERESVPASEREVKRESVPASEHEVKRESLSPPPLPVTDAAPSISTYRPSAAALVKAESSSSIPRAAGPSRRRRSSPRLSPYSFNPSSEEQEQEQEAEEVSPSTVRRSARIAAAKKRDEAKRKGKGKATDA